MAASEVGDLMNGEWSDDEVQQNGSDECSDDDHSSASDDENDVEEIPAVDYTPLELLHGHRKRTSTSCPQSGTSSVCPESSTHHLRSQAAAGTESRRQKTGSQSIGFRPVRGRSGSEVMTFTNPMRQQSSGRQQSLARQRPATGTENRTGNCENRVGGRRPATLKKRMRKNGNWTEEQLRSAISALDDGVSLRKAAEDNNIPVTSLRDWYQGRTRSRSRGKKGVLTADEESQLVQYLIKMCDSGYGLSPNALKMKVYEISKSRSTPFRDGIPGGGWMRWFRIQHPELTIRAAQTLETARAKALCPENVATLYNNLEELYDKHQYPPHRIWNCDESGAQAAPESNVSTAAESNDLFRSVPKN